MCAAYPSSLAACATATPWLPPEAATTPAAGTLRRRRLVKAPRALNDPACWSSSSLNTSATPGSPKSRPSTWTMGVVRTCGRMARSARAIWSRPTGRSEGATEHPMRLGDASVVAAVEGPLLDALGPDQAQVAEDLEVLVRARLRDAQLVGDEEAADAVLDPIAVHLGREVAGGPLEPVEDPQAPLVGERRRHVGGKHLGSMLSA